MNELSTEHFNKLAQQIYLRLGLHFEEKKSYFLQKRVEKRMEVLGFHDPQDYVFQLCYADPDGKEMQALANLITTNETYMFREYEQLEAFANSCLPEVLSAKQARGEQKLRIWCAGCSSGEEAYTLAIILQEIFPQSQYWDCEIVATDIDQNMLAQAAARPILVAVGPGCAARIPRQILHPRGRQLLGSSQSFRVCEISTSESARPDGDALHAELRFHLLP